MLLNTAVLVFICMFVDSFVIHHFSDITYFLLLDLSEYVLVLYSVYACCL